VTAKLNHLTSVYYGLKPDSAVGPSKHVTVHIDGPALSTGPEARALVFRKGVGVTVKPFVLNSAGDGQLRLGFGRGTVTRVVIVMSNAT